MHMRFAIIFSFLLLCPLVVMGLESEEGEEESGLTGGIFSIFTKHFGDEEEREGQILAVDETLKMDARSGGSIRIIDKTLGKKYTFDLHAGEVCTVKEITVKLLKCASPSESTIVPSGRALVEVQYTKHRKSETIFKGWIYANSSVSHISNPHYSIWLNQCFRESLASGSSSE